MLQHVPRQSQNENMVTMVTDGNDYFYPDDFSSKYRCSDVVERDITIATNTAPRDSIIKHFIPHVDYTLDDSWLYSLGPLGISEDEDDYSNFLNGSNATLQTDATPTQNLRHLYVRSDSKDSGFISERPSSGSRKSLNGATTRKQHLKYGMVYENIDNDNNSNTLSGKLNDCQEEHLALHKLSGTSCSDKAWKSTNPENRHQEGRTWKSPDSENSCNGRSRQKPFKKENRNETLTKSRQNENSDSADFLKSPNERNGRTERVLKSPVVKREKIRYVSDIPDKPLKLNKSTSQKLNQVQMNGSIEHEDEKEKRDEKEDEKRKETRFDKIKNKKADGEKKSNENNLSPSKDQFFTELKEDTLKHDTSTRKEEKMKSRKLRPVKHTDIQMLRDISLDHEDENNNPMQLRREKYFSCNVKCSSEQCVTTNSTEDDQPQIIAFNTHIKHEMDTSTSASRIAKTVKTVLKTIPFGSNRKDSNRQPNKSRDNFKVKSKSLTPLTAQAMVMGKLHQTISHGTKNTYKRPTSLQISNNSDVNATSTTTVKSMFKSLRSSSADRIDVVRRSKSHPAPGRVSKTEASSNSKAKSVLKSNDEVKMRVLFSRDDTAWAFKRRNSFGPSCTRKPSTLSIEDDIAPRPMSIEEESNRDSTSRLRSRSFTPSLGESSTPDTNRGVGSRLRSKSFTPGTQSAGNTDLFFHERIVPTAASTGGSLRRRKQKHTSKACDYAKLRSKSCERTTFSGSRKETRDHEDVSKSHGHVKKRSQSCDSIKMRCIFYEDDDGPIKVKRSKSFGSKIKNSQEGDRACEPRRDKDLSVPERIEIQEKLLQDLEHAYRSEESSYDVPIKSTESNSMPPTSNTTHDNKTQQSRQSAILDKTLESKQFWKNLELGLCALQHDLNAHDFDSDLGKVLENEIGTDLLNGVTDSIVLQNNQHLSFRNGEKLSFICEMIRNETKLDPVDPQEKEQTFSITPFINEESCSNIDSSQTEKGSHVDDILISELRRGFHLDAILSTLSNGSTRLLARDRLKSLQIKEKVKELRDQKMNAREILNVLLLDVIREKPSQQTRPNAAEEMTEGDEIVANENEIIGKENETDVLGELNETNSYLFSTDIDDKKSPNITDMITNEEMLSNEEMLTRELKIIEELFQNIDSKQLLKELNLSDEKLFTMMQKIKPNAPMKEPRVNEACQGSDVNALDGGSKQENACSTSACCEALADKKDEIAGTEGLIENLDVIDAPDGKNGGPDCSGRETPRTESGGSYHECNRLSLVEDGLCQSTDASEELNEIDLQNEDVELTGRGVKEKEDEGMPNGVNRTVHMLLQEINLEELDALIRGMESPDSETKENPNTITEIDRYGEEREEVEEELFHCIDLTDTRSEISFDDVFFSDDETPLDEQNVLYTKNKHTNVSQVVEELCVSVNVNELRESNFNDNFFMLSDEETEDDMFNNSVWDTSGECYLGLLDNENKLASEYDECGQEKAQQLISHDEFCLSFEFDTFDKFDKLKCEVSFDDYSVVLKCDDNLYDQNTREALTQEPFSAEYNAAEDTDLPDGDISAQINALLDHNIQTQEAQSPPPILKSNDTESESSLGPAIWILSDDDATSIENEPIAKEDRNLPEVMAEVLHETIEVVEEELHETIELDQHEEPSELHDGSTLSYSSKEVSDIMEELRESVNSDQLLNVYTSSYVTTVHSSDDSNDVTERENIENVDERDNDRTPSSDISETEGTMLIENYQTHDYDVCHVNSQSTTYLRQEEYLQGVDADNSDLDAEDANAISVYGERTSIQTQTVHEDMQELIPNYSYQGEGSKLSENEVTLDIFIPDDGDDTSLTIEIIIGDEEDENTEKTKLLCHGTAPTEGESGLTDRILVEKCKEPAVREKLFLDVESGQLHPDSSDTKAIQQRMRRLCEDEVELNKFLNDHFFDGEREHTNYLMGRNNTGNVTSTVKENGSTRSGEVSLETPSDLSVFSIEDIDSGTDLQYDDLFSPTDTKEKDNDYNTWLSSIKPLLIDSEVVANLFVRLANKYTEYKSLDKKPYYMQQVHMATTAYDVITDNNLTNFAHVISHLLSFVGAIKCEKQPPDSVNIGNMLLFLEQLVEKGSLSTFHITLFTVLLSRPNEKLKRYHSLRVNLLHTCFVQEIRRLKITSGELYYLHICFMKISEYFVHLDKEMCSTLIDEYILPNLSVKTSLEFVNSVLQYMDLLNEGAKNENVIKTTDISSSLVLLGMIYKRKPLPTIATQRLHTILQSDHPKFKFCEQERKMLIEILRDLKYSGCKLLDQ